MIALYLYFMIPIRHNRSISQIPLDMRKHVAILRRRHVGGLYQRQHVHNVYNTKDAGRLTLCAIPILVLYRSGRIPCIYRLQPPSIHFSKPSHHHNKRTSRQILPVLVNTLFLFLTFGALIY
jgi:hypothetical protein